MATINDFLGKPARQNVEQVLAVAKDKSDYNALLSLIEDRALERADAVDRGEVTGRLAGVPFAVKDNILTYGAPTTAASHMLENFVAPFQATAVERLEAEGAICIGKANLDSFAHGGSTENSAFGPTKNAADKTRVAGGSSGGSAAAVALDIVPFALGTDTGGSIRQPASFNGVIGVKPTYGAVSRHGVISFASSTDVVGCFTNSASDAELVMEIMSGQDKHDMTSLPDYFVPRQLKQPLKIGVVKEFIDAVIDQETKDLTENYIEKLRQSGQIVEEVSLPMVEVALPAYYVITSAEATSNLARFDGIRYGKRSSRATDLTSLYELTRQDEFELEAKRRILFGNYVLSSKNFESHFQQAERVRTLIIESLDQALAKFDVLVGPTTPTPAFRFGEYSAFQMRQADIILVSASLAGLPAVSAPAGRTDAGLPVGVQLIGRLQSDVELLSLVELVAEGEKK